MPNMPVIVAGPGGGIRYGIANTILAMTTRNVNEILFFGDLDIIEVVFIYVAEYIAITLFPRLGE